MSFWDSRNDVNAILVIVECTPPVRSRGIPGKLNVVNLLVAAEVVDGAEKHRKTRPIIFRETVLTTLLLDQ
jgi:hypothetical protein